MSVFFYSTQFSNNLDKKSTKFDDLPFLIVVQSPNWDIIIHYIAIMYFFLYIDFLCVTAMEKYLFFCCE